MDANDDAPFLDKRSAAGIIASSLLQKIATGNKKPRCSRNGVLG